jgi:hypothetical protein
MNESFDEYILKITLDTIFPLNNGIYKIQKKEINKLSLYVNNNFEYKKKSGSFNIHGDVYIHQGHGCGRSDLELTYSCEELLSIEGFSKKMSISPVWHSSATGWNFILEDLNRIIDLYRHLANTYWWHHLSMWNIDELKIYGKSTRQNKPVFISQSMSPKTIKFGGKPLDDIAYNNNSNYLKSISSGLELPFYFLMYLNGKRSFIENSYREALINWANCIEAYGMYLLHSACKIAKISSIQKEKYINAADKYNKCYSKTYEILANVKIYPSIKKKKAMQLVNQVMEYRNDVMHGDNPNLDWKIVGQKQDAIDELLSIIIEISK